MLRLQVLNGCSARFHLGAKKVVFSTFWLSLIALLQFVSPVVRAASQSERIEVLINGMVCSFCVQGIEKKLRALPETQAVKINLGQHLVDLTLRPGQVISDAQLRKLIRDAGFDVREIKRVKPAP